MAGHRWSGWPGAWCLDCGQEDLIEIAVADGYWIDEDGTFTDPQGNPISELPVEYQNGTCPEPGSKRHDPYAKMPPATEA